MASVQLRKDRRNKQKGESLFLAQSPISNYCGIYSTGMLLSLLGHRTDRSAVLSLFNLNRNNPNYRGATDDEIGEVFARVANPETWHWEYQRQFDFSSISQSLCEQLESNGLPTLLSFGAVHKNGLWKSRHITVAISATVEMITLLDPLGRKPPKGRKSNVAFRLENPHQRVRVIGSSYCVNSKSRAAIFHWT